MPLIVVEEGKHALECLIPDFDLWVGAFELVNVK